MIVNLTPHDVVLQTSAQQIVLPKARVPARVRVSRDIEKIVDGIPIFRERVDYIENLPRPKEGTYYIVSSMTFAAGKQRGRKDLLLPDSRTYSLLSRSFK